MAIPRDVRRCLAAWLLVWALLFAGASVPAFSPPWIVAATPARFAVIQYWWPWLAGVFLLGSILLRLPLSWAFQTRSLATIRHMRVEHRAVLWLLLVATVLRFALVMRGGQYFDWDEVRYGGSATWMFAYVSTGNLRGALDMLLRSPDHPGFRIVGLVLAFFHVVSAWTTGRPITEMRYNTGEWLPAFLLSLSSVCAIGLTYALAIRAGASRRESLLAAFLMFASSSMLIYTQHFFPYDASMALLLLALWIGLHDAGYPWRSFCVGLLCGAAILTYEGYWLMAAVAGGIHVLRRPSSLPRAVARGILVAAGAALWPGLLVMAGRLTGRPFLEATQRFSRSAVNGDFSEGWSLPWEYLWQTEHALLFVYAFGVVTLTMLLVRQKDAKHGATWLAAAGAVYLGLIMGSNVLHRFVVYDRLARQMLPFICLAAAAGLARLKNGRLLNGVPALALYGAITVIFVLNAVPLATQRYPRDVALEAVRQFGADNVRLDMTVLHSDVATEPVFLPFATDRVHTGPAGPLKRYARDCAPYDQASPRAPQHAVPRIPDRRARVPAVVGFVDQAD